MVMAPAVVAVVAAIVSVFVVVVGADRVRVVLELTGQQGLHLGVRAAGGAGKEPDAGLRQGIPGAAADAAADQRVYPVGLQKAGQGPVAAAAGAHHLAGGHFAAVDLIELELFRVAKVLEHLAVVVGYRDFHERQPPASMMTAGPDGAAAAQISRETDDLFDVIIAHLPEKAKSREVHLTPVLNEMWTS